MHCSQRQEFKCNNRSDFSLSVRFITKRFSKSSGKSWLFLSFLRLFRKFGLVCSLKQEEVSALLSGRTLPACWKQSTLSLFCFSDPHSDCVGQSPQKLDFIITPVTPPCVVCVRVIFCSLIRRHFLCTPCDELNVLEPLLELIFSPSLIFCPVEPSHQRMITGLFGGLEVVFVSRCVF